MLSQSDYIRMSLDLDLFFLRIMKEHSFFLAAAFTDANGGRKQEAIAFSKQFAALLTEAISLSNGVLTPQAINSGQFFTSFTITAEVATQSLSGIPLAPGITQREIGLQPGTGPFPPGLEARVFDLNQRAIASVEALAAFKAKLLADVLTCRLFLNTYPLLIDHILREAHFFHGLLVKLQNRVNIRTEQDMVEQEIFWNRIMAEHAKFIRGLLDPTEETLFETANMFGHEFDELTAEAQQAQNNAMLLPKVTADSLDATKKIRDFKAAGTGGILQCKIRSMIIPLLGDHVLREANHFLFILQKGDAPRMG